MTKTYSNTPGATATALGTAGERQARSDYTACPNVARLITLGRTDYTAARRAVAELATPELERLIEVITRARWAADRALVRGGGAGIASSYLPEDLARADYYARRIATMARDEHRARRQRAAQTEARAIFAELVSA